jgi:hypothetical protein
MLRGREPNDVRLPSPLPSPGHEPGPRGRAAGAGAEARELDALRGEAVEVGGVEVLFRWHPEVAPALVVGEDEDDVGRALLGSG